MPTTDAAQIAPPNAKPKTATEQMAALDRHRAKLLGRQARNTAARTTADIGGDTTLLDTEKRAIIDHLDNLDLAEAKLEPEVKKEERLRLIDEQKAAFARQVACDENRAKQKLKMIEAERVYNEERKEFERLGLVTGGVYEASLRLTKHRTAHPEVQEEEV